MSGTQGAGCNTANCMAPRSRPGKRHDWSYHVIPVPFELGGATVCFQMKGGKLVCPFPGCSTLLNRRDRATRHIRQNHGADEMVRIFEGPVEENEGAVDGLGLAGMLEEGNERDYNPGDEALGGVPGDAAGGKDRAPGRVVLQPGVDYLQGGGVLDALGVWFHHALKVFICRACQICLTSEAVKGHCKGQHQATITEAVTEALQAFCARHKVHRRPEEAVLPHPGGPAVQALPPPEAGLACGVAGCLYSVKDEASMRKHERREHGRAPLQAFTYRPSKLQTLFQGVGKTYFEVEVEAMKARSLHLRDALKRVGVSLDEVGEAAIATDKDRTPPPLLRVTGWADHLPEVRANRTLRADALALKAKRKAEELGGILPRLEAAVDQIFESGRTILNGHSSKLTVLKFLIHGENVPSEGAMHWKAISALNTEYPAFVKELLTAVLRSSLAPSRSGGFHFVLSQEQESSLRALEGALKRKDAAKEVSCCHEFIWSTVSAKDGGRWKDVTQQWMWLRALRPDSNFYGAASLTPDLAKLKYMMRQATLLQAFIEQVESEEELIQRVGRLHASVLKLGTPTPFNMVTELSQYASSLVLLEVKDPKVTISGDYGAFTVGTQTMVLDKLREGLGKAIDGAWTAYGDIVQCDRVVPAEIHVADDVSNDLRGYSFLHERPFCEKPRAMFYRLVNVYRLASVDYEGTLCWDIPQVKSLLAKCERMWDAVLHILFITMGVSTRVSQFMRSQIRNGDRQRNVEFRNGEMFFVTRDSKTSSAAGRDSCIPSFPPPQASQLLLEFIGGGLREAEALLVGVVYGAESMELHRSYLCMRDGKRMEPEQFYSRFAAKNSELFDCAWNCRDYRQAAIAMARHFISADATFAALDDALAEAADHSTNTDHVHYGKTFGDHPCLTHTDIEKQRWICQEWHSFLGLGPFPVQEPITAVRSRGSPGFDKEGIKSVLAGMLPELSCAIADEVMKRLQAPLPGALAAKEMPVTLATSAPHANATPTTSRPLAAARTPIGTGVSVEPHSSKAQSSVRMPHPGATVVPSSSRFREGSAPPFPRPEKRASSRKLDWSLPSAGGQRFQMELDVFSSDPLTPVVSPSNPSRRLIDGKGKGKEVPTEHMVATQVFSSLDFSSAPSSPAPHPQTPLHRKPTAGPQALSSQPPLLLGQRKRRAPEPTDLDLEPEQGAGTPPKRLRRDASAPSHPLFSDSPSHDEVEDVDDDFDSLDSMADFIAPSTPDLTTENLRQSIRSAIARTVGDPNAREKSAEQMDALLAIMNEDPRDMAVVLRTGGGKSLLWTIPPLLDIPGISVVICPFKSLMDQQYKRCVKAGVRCQNYGESKVVRDGVQNLFLQVEHLGMEVFQNLLVQPNGKQIKRVFIDEFHDILQCHPDRRSKWQTLARQCAQMDIQVILLSATCPPAMADTLLRPFRVNKNHINFIRGPTDRPEIGLHYIRAIYTPENNALHSIVNCLHDKLRPEERILVFFNGKKELDKFAAKARCASYHGDLWEPGNTRAENMQRWDLGETRVMACTTGFAQGMDMAHVRFVVMKDPEYGLLLAMQMIGRAGRDGKESHAVVVDTQPGQIFTNWDLTTSNSVKDVLGNDSRCRVLSTTAALDGSEYEHQCKQRPARVACDVCNPGHPIHRAIVAASKEGAGPIRPLVPPQAQVPRAAKVRRVGEVARPLMVLFVPRLHAQAEADDAGRNPLACMWQVARAPEGRICTQRLPTPQDHREQPLSQDSDDLYGLPVIDAAVSWQLAEMEGHHGPPLECARAPNGGLVRSVTLAGLPHATEGGWKAPDFSRSVSQPEGTSARRAAEAQRIKRQRLERTKKLNKYVPVIKNQCPAHLLEKGVLVPEHFPAPCSDLESVGQRYYSFRKRFNFKAYAYCFTCGLPQDQNRNGEGPECHKAFVPGGKDKCPFQFVVFKVAFVAGQIDELLAEMRRALEIPGQSFEDYLAWAASQEEVEGRYHNAIEVFLWCCERLEANNPRLFL
ncbi:hypothetical protein HD554DRAFT_2038970 [Boletus coccyginus]|nr:hypothetical protein HD554DRAFT_2038970 [Boletus coccyginus]